MAEEKKICILPPLGWFCTRESGHEGPCAAHPISSYAQDVEKLRHENEALRQSQISTIEIKDGSILVVRNWETAQAIAGAKVGVNVTIIVAPDGIDEMTPELLEETARRAKRSNSQS